MQSLITKKIDKKRRTKRKNSKWINISVTLLTRTSVLSPNCNRPRNNYTRHEVQFCHEMIVPNSRRPEITFHHDKYMICYSKQNALVLSRNYFCYEPIWCNEKFVTPSSRSLVLSPSSLSRSKDSSRTRHIHHLPIFIWKQFSYANCWMYIKSSGKQ